MRCCCCCYSGCYGRAGQVGASGCLPMGRGRVVEPLWPPQAAAAGGRRRLPPSANSSKHSTCMPLPLPLPPPLLLRRAGLRAQMLLLADLNWGGCADEFVM